MADKTINVLCICGSLRKGSYNRMVMNALPGLAPEGMKFTEAPSFAGFSIYNFDDQEFARRTARRAKARRRHPRRRRRDVQHAGI